MVAWAALLVRPTSALNGNFVRCALLLVAGQSLIV
jgi:hypothetical protein